LYRGGVAVSRIGGAAEVDVKERKDRPAEVVRCALQDSASVAGRLHDRGRSHPVGPK